MLRLAELGARECDGRMLSRFLSSSPLSANAGSKSKCGKLEAPLAPVANYGWMTGKREIIPM